MNKLPFLAACVALAGCATDVPRVVSPGMVASEVAARAGKPIAEGRLADNYLAVVDEIVRAKPSAAKGKYIRSLTLSSTMGPGIRIDTTHIDVVVKH